MLLNVMLGNFIIELTNKEIMFLFLLFITLSLSITSLVIASRK